MTAATEYAAGALAYQRALGEPLVKFGTTFLCPPWACMDWFRRFHLQAPRVFAVVQGIAFGGGLISFLLLLGAITRLRGRPVSTAHGSARWATEDDLRRVGLLDQAGLVLCDAVYFGAGVIWGAGSPGGHNNGPWVMADLENGLYAGWENNQDQMISTNTPLKYDYVTAILVGDTASQNGGKGRFALFGGDASSGTLKTMYDGIRPSKPGYVPMHKQGSIILGIGGDNSGGDEGQWFEGVMASGAATVATLNALQSNIVGAGYGK